MTSFPGTLREVDTIFTRNAIWVGRTQGVGVISAADAINWSLSGPMLRASGVPFDVRKDRPYLGYETFDFDIPVGQHGDIYDRYLIRMDEMRQSLRILEQVLPHLKRTQGGPIVSEKPQYGLRAPRSGEAYGRVENPKGELGYYVTSKRRGANPERYHVRAPSFINLTALGPMGRGNKVADLVAVLGSIDIVLGEVDR